MNVDSHCHLAANSLVNSLPSVLQGLHESETIAVSCGNGPESWARQAAIASQSNMVRCCYGLHPWHWRSSSRSQTPEVNPVHVLNDSLAELRHFLTSPVTPSAKPVALGEIGLDLAQPQDRLTFPFQLQAFRQQLSIARSLNLPVIIHSVKAHSQTLVLLRRDQLPARGGLLHGFWGSPELARNYLQLGLHISINSQRLFQAATSGPSATILRKKITELLAVIPPERLILETDSPAPLRPTPACLLTIAKSLAYFSGIKVPELLEQCNVNAILLFHLLR